MATKSRVPRTTRRRAPKERLDDAHALERAVFAACEAEYERRWGTTWLRPGGGGFARTVANFVGADGSNREAEDKARKVYTLVHRRLRRALDPEREWIAGLPDGVGGAATERLKLLLAFVDAVDERGDLEERDRDAPRAAFVRRWGGRPVSLLPGTPRLSNWELAVIAILAGIGGPTSWKHAAQRAMSPNDVIREEESAIARVRRNP